MFLLPLLAAILTTVPAAASTPAVPIYVARPDGNGPFPAVLILHSCAGFDGFDAVAADRLVPLGYVAVALDALGRREPTGACGNDNGAGYTAEVTAAWATLAWMRAQPYIAADRLAIIGFSMGADALLALVDPPGAQATPPAGLRAAVAFEPSCDGTKPNVRVPLAIFDGDADQIAPAAPCAALARAASSNGTAVQITTYQGATHGFNVPGPDRTFYGQPMRFDPEATADAARQTVSFLKQYL